MDSRAIEPDSQPDLSAFNVQLRPIRFMGPDAGSCHSMEVSSHDSGCCVLLIRYGIKLLRTDFFDGILYFYISSSLLYVDKILVYQSHYMENDGV